MAEEILTEAPMPDRYDRLAELWNVSREKAKEIDDQCKAANQAAKERQAARRAEFAAAEVSEKKAANAPAAAATPAKSAAAGSEKVKKDAGTAA